MIYISNIVEFNLNILIIYKLFNLIELYKINIDLNYVSRYYQDVFIRFIYVDLFAGHNGVSAVDANGIDRAEDFCVVQQSLVI
jgi:hypothetical protein